ncbi:MAG: hypothetical protein H6740_02515 [Alphaproteobacteria bacterium]|nr:hypothetical protein [Alphaproteobacteria bacterium]
MSWLLLLACGRGLDCALPEPVFDECEPLCVQVEGASPEATLRSGLDGALEVTVSEGQVCAEAPLSVGVHRLTLEDGDEACELTAEVRPFGWAYGLEKPLEALTELPWIPEITGLDAAPLFSPAEGAWDAVNVSMPSRVDFEGEPLLFYAGTDHVGVYQLGVAALIDETWTRVAGPILDASATGAQPGDWDYDGQNTPEALVADGQLTLFYNGRDDSRLTLSIGRAVSEDGRHFTPEGLVLAGRASVTAEETAVAHPTVLLREGRAGPVWELWHATGTLEIGYALSRDGLRFERYCGGSVFEGTGGWDEDEVKAPEVHVADDTYYMAYSGCGRGCYQIGWAASSDGLRWVAAEEPILPAGGADWASATTQGADIVVDGDTWRFWYAGSDGVQTAIGVGEARYSP